MAFPKNKKRTRRYLALLSSLAFFGFLLIFFGGNFLNFIETFEKKENWKGIKPANAQINPNNVEGWLWGGTEDNLIDGNLGTSDGNETGAGWISTNSLNCDSDGDGITDQGNSSSCPEAGTVVNYGLHIPESDGTLSGYVWSRNLGWISFNESDLGGCPSGTCNARREGNLLKGWARIMSIANESASNNGNWEGFISLSITINNEGGLSGYAWSGEDDYGENGCYHSNGCGLGYISFDGANIISPPTVDLEIEDSVEDKLKITLEQEGDALPETKNFSWTVEGATFCEASCSDTVENCGAWAGAKNSEGGSEDVEINGGSTVEYVLTCRNIIGDKAEDSVLVETGCFHNKCAGCSCDEIFEKMTSFNTEKCADECQTKKECCPGRTNWFETN